MMFTRLSQFYNSDEWRSFRRLIHECTNKADSNITEAEYRQIADAISNRPVDAPNGYTYRLRTDLTWELVELPPAPVEPMPYTQESLESMTNAELEQILYGYSITASMNKANMVRLILAAQGN